MVGQTITVITGASRGLGRAAARHLASVAGYLVVATARANTLVADQHRDVRLRDDLRRLAAGNDVGDARGAVRSH